MPRAQGILSRFGFTGLGIRGSGGAPTPIDYPARWGAVAAWEVLTDLADSEGSHTLTNVNSVTSGAAIAAGLGTSGQFVAASTQSMTAADADTLSPEAGDWGLSLWVYLDTVGANRGIAFKGTGLSNAALEFALRYIEATQRFRLDFGDATGTTQVAMTITNSGVIAATTPYHVFIYHDSVNDVLGGIVNNGTPTTTATGGISPSNTASTFKLGIYNVSTTPHDGRISDVTVFKATPGGIASRISEITERIYNGGTGRSYPWS